MAEPTKTYKVTDANGNEHVHKADRIKRDSDWLELIASEQLQLMRKEDRHYSSMLTDAMPGQTINHEMLVAVYYKPICVEPINA